MLFVWVDVKSLYFKVCVAAEEMGFELKETINWARRNVANRYVFKKNQTEKTYFRRISETCLVFRRVTKKGKNLRFELRHQRSSDVLNGFVRYDPGLRAVCWSVLPIR